MGTAVRIGLGVLICYSLYCLVIFLFQRWLVFPRYAIPADKSEPAPTLGRETWWLETSQGRVEAWFFPPTGIKGKSGAPAVIFAHGNAELIDFWPEEFQRFVRWGIGVLLVEYPGYGRSEGSPSQNSVTEAFLAAYDRLVARSDVDPHRIVLFGRSIGGGAVCALAQKRPTAALILASTFTHIQAFSWRFLVPPFLVRDPFDNLSVLHAYEQPVLIVHGNHDTLVPYKHSAVLARAAKKGKRVTYACGHNDCPPDWTVFMEDVYSFFLDNNILPGHRGGKDVERK